MAIHAVKNKASCTCREQRRPERQVPLHRREPEPFGPIQTKLTAGPAQDRFEADRIAEQVIRMQDSAVPGRLTPPVISRLPDRSVRRQPIKEEEEELHAESAMVQTDCGRGHRWAPVLKPSSTGGAAPGFGQRPAVQAKLTIRAPDDAWEQEADRVANEVMHSSQPAARESQEKLISGASESKVSPVHAGSGAVTPEVSATTEWRINSLRGSGHPLEPATRDFMSARLGHDVAHVRVHTGERAAQTAQALNARAFTIGRDVVFARGEYSPRSYVGRRLIAHELAHVFQQTRAGSSNRHSTSSVICRQDGPESETTVSLLWNESELEQWLREDLAEIDAAIDECDTVWTPRSMCKAPYGGPITDAKTGYLLGKQLLRMVSAGHTDPPKDSIPWYALTNPGGLEPKRLVAEIVKQRRNAQLRPTLEAVDTTGELQKREARRELNRLYDRYVFSPWPSEDRAFVDELEDEIVGGVTSTLEDVAL